STKSTSSSFHPPHAQHYLLPKPLYLSAYISSHFKQLCLIPLQLRKVTRHSKPSTTSKRTYVLTQNANTLENKYQPFNSHNRFSKKEYSIPSNFIKDYVRWN